MGTTRVWKKRPSVNVHNEKIGKPNNLKLFGRNLVSENMTAFILGKCVKITYFIILFYIIKQ